MPQDDETMPLSDKEIIEIMQALNESKFDELRLEVPGLKLVLSKSGMVVERPEAGPVASDGPGEAERAAEVPPAPAKPETAAGAATGAAPDGATGDEEGLIPIKAPILGFFYIAPEPGAPPFVEVGSEVTADDTVCLVEVMKLFNTIKAGIGGRIARVCAENGKMVEFEQTLFLVEPAAAGRKPRKKKPAAG